MIPTIAESPTSLASVVSLVDAISCTVSKSESGEFVLKMQYPISGAFAEKITLNNQINAITNRADSAAQPFLIAKIEQNISGVLSITANHRAYELSKYPVRAFEEEERTPAEAVAALYENGLKSLASGGLYVKAEESSEKQLFGLSKATTWREALFGKGGLLDVYGGVLVSNGRIVTWKPKSAVGEQKGIVRYGVNLSKFARVYDISDTYSHAYVFWKSGSDFVDSSELVQLGDDESFTGATVLDLSRYFDDEPTIEQLEEKAIEIAEKDSLTKTEVSLDISFVPLRLTDEYRNMTWLEEVDLYDKITVEVPMFGARSTATITATNFDVISENYKSISVGTPRRNLNTTLARLI